MGIRERLTRIERAVGRRRPKEPDLLPILVIAIQKGVCTFLERAPDGRTDYAVSEDELEDFLTAHGWERSRRIYLHPDDED
jgi:hypothetical protein